jgi:hypothetical protein
MSVRSLFRNITFDLADRKAYDMHVSLLAHMALTHTSCYDKIIRHTINTMHMAYHDGIYASRLRSYDLLAFIQCQTDFIKLPDHIELSQYNDYSLNLWFDIANACLLIIINRLNPKHKPTDLINECDAVLQAVGAQIKKHIDRPRGQFINFISKYSEQCKNFDFDKYPYKHLTQKQNELWESVKLFYKYACQYKEGAKSGYMHAIDYFQACMEKIRQMPEDHEYLKYKLIAQVNRDMCNSLTGDYASILFEICMILIYKMLAYYKYTNQRKIQDYADQAIVNLQSTYQCE